MDVMDVEAGCAEATYRPRRNARVSFLAAKAAASHQAAAAAAETESSGNKKTRKRKKGGSRGPKTAPVEVPGEPNEPDVQEDTACSVCGSTDEAETMLLCDSCDAGFHTLCLSPKLETIPEGDWFCAGCKASGKEKAHHATGCNAPPPHPPSSSAAAEQAATAPQEDPSGSPPAALSGSSDEEEEEEQEEEGSEEESDWSAASDDDEKAVWKPRARKRQATAMAKRERMSRASSSISSRSVAVEVDMSAEIKDKVPAQPSVAVAEGAQGGTVGAAEDNQALPVCPVKDEAAQSSAAASLETIEAIVSRHGDKENAPMSHGTVACPPAPGNAAKAALEAAEKEEASFAESLRSEEEEEATHYVPGAAPSLLESAPGAGRWCEVVKSRHDACPGHMRLVVREQVRKKKEQRQSVQEDATRITGTVWMEVASLDAALPLARKDTKEDKQSRRVGGMTPGAHREILVRNDSFVATSSKCSSLKGFVSPLSVPGAASSWQPLDLQACMWLRPALAALAFRHRHQGARVLSEHRLAAGVRSYLGDLGLTADDGLVFLPVETARLKQSLTVPVTLPGLSRLWCHVDSLGKLEARLETAQSCGRLLMIVASYQPELWCGMFAKWAESYPQIMFASIHTEVANQGRHTHQLRRLLGVEFVDGIHFASVTRGDVVRGFNALSTSTPEVEAQLIARYHASVHDGLLPQAEPGGISSRLDVNAPAACRALVSGLAFPPPDPTTVLAAVKVEPRHHTSSQSAADEGGEGGGSEGASMDAPRQLSHLQPVGHLEGRPLRSNAETPPHPQPLLLSSSGTRTRLRPDQLRSLQWMVLQERSALAVRSETFHTATLGHVPPAQSLAVQWRLQARYALRGGILADAVGFGKTGVCVGLVASSADAGPPSLSDLPGGAEAGLEHLRPTGATLVLVEPMIVKQWASEFAKFAPGLKVLAILHTAELMAATKINPATGKAKVETVDAVILSEKLFMSENYLGLLNCDAIKHSTPLDWDRSYLAALEHLRKRPLDKKAPGHPLERFLWRRLIMDEVHSKLGPREFTSALGTEPVPSKKIRDALNVWCPPLRHLAAWSRWGLTGTPPVHDVEEVHQLGLLMQVHIGNSARAALSFLGRFVRSSKADDPMPEPVERWTYVDLTVEEAALYRQARYEKLQGLRRQDAAAVLELIEASSHFSLGAGSSREPAASAEDEVKRLLAKKEKAVASKRRKADEHAASLSRLNEELRNLQHSEGAESFGSLAQKIAAARGRCEEMSDRFTNARAELRQLESSLNFMKDTLEKLKGGQMCPECPVCLTGLQEGAAPAVILDDCSHVYCEPCARQLATEHGRCASCRHPLRVGGWKRVELNQGVGGLQQQQQKQQEGAGAAYFDRPAKDILVKYGAFGSKIAYVATRLHQIREVDPTDKCLVFCQTNELKIKLARALEQFKFGVVVLQGGPTDMATRLKKFKEIPSMTVLVCSVQQKAAGTNLQHANHVLFVHPFFELREEEMAKLEAQAIGRVQRCGQKKQTYLHRFVSAHTIEHELVVQRHCDRWRDYFNLLAANKTQGPPGTAPA